MNSPITPPPPAFIISTSNSLDVEESQSVESQQGDEDTVLQIQSLPVQNVSRQTSLTESQRDDLQKTLDKYKVSWSQAYGQSAASVVGTLSGAATAVGRVISNRVPFTHYHFPVLPMFLLKHLGITKTLGFFTVVGICGGLYGRVKAAEEIYNKTPEQNLTDKIFQLNDDISYHSEQMLNARFDCLKVEGRWKQLLPDLDINSPLALEVIQNTLTHYTEMTSTASVRFFENEVNKQISGIDRLKEHLRTLQQREANGEDVTLELLRVEFDLTAEQKALETLQQLLDSSRKEPTSDPYSHFERQQMISSDLKPDSYFQVALDTYNEYLEAKAAKNRSTALRVKAVSELIKVLADKQKVKLALEQGMKPKLE